MRKNIVQIPFKKFWDRSFAVSCFPPTWYIFQRLGGAVAFVAYKSRLSPNIITVLGGLIGSYAIWQFSTLPLGMVETIHLSMIFSFVYILDCTDGQLARATGKTSKSGKWFDIGVDFYLIILFPVGISIFIKNLHIGTNIDWMVIGLILGRSMVLIVSSLKRSDGKDHQPSSLFLKKIIQSILDTPVFYIWMCCARINPEWLIISTMIFGGLYIFESIYLSRTFFK